MAILDTEYVKAPSLRAGDLSITKSSTGFSIFEGNTVFLTGATDGTLTIGKENLTSSISTLHINAEEVYWNNKPLEDYWEGESGPVVPDLTQDVTELQELTAANTQAIQNTDERLSQKISDLRMDALGAKVNTLVNPINNYVSNICGIAVPVTLLKESLPYFNKITLNNVQNAGTGYLAIYACDEETPNTSSPCTLLYVSEEPFETTGAPTVPTSSILEIPEKITVPDSGLILLIFASSAAAPQADNISWVTTENSTMFIRMGIYSPGGTNRPYDTNGEYVLQKVTNAYFLTYSPDIDFSYVYDDTEDILIADVEVIKSQISDLRSDLEGYTTSVETLSGDVEAVKSQIEDLTSDLEDYMTSEETIEVVTSQINDLKSDLADYMTYEETMEAIASFPDDGVDSRLYNLGSLVDALTVPTLPFELVKKAGIYSSSMEFTGNAFNLTSAADLDESSGSYIAAAELNLFSDIAQLTLNQARAGYYNPAAVTSLYMHNVGSAYSRAGAMELKSIYQVNADGASAQVYLATNPGKLELGLQEDGQNLFQFLARTSYDNEPSSSGTGVHLIYRSPDNSYLGNKLSMQENSTVLSTYNSSSSGRLSIGTDSVAMAVNSYTLYMNYEGMLSLAPGENSAWDRYIDSASSTIPTISIVHYLIQQALANQ